MLLLADIAHGHVDLADVLFLVAFILFVIAAVIVALVKPVAIHVVLALIGLACMALAWVVL